VNEKPKVQRLRNWLFLIGTILVVVGIGLTVLSLFGKPPIPTTPVLMICYGGIGLFAGFILPFIKISRVETPSEPQISTNKIKFGLPGLLAGLLLGYILLFLLSATWYWIGMAIVMFTALSIVFRRGANLSSDWRMAIAGFVSGYILVFAMRLCLASLASIPPGG